MTLNYPLRTGVAFAVTVGFAYAACSLVFWIWPEAAAAFTNALFHGVDFRKLQTGPKLFDFSGFVYVLVAMTAWAFALGALFGWVSARLSGRHATRVVTDQRSTGRPAARHSGSPASNRRALRPFLRSSETAS